MNVDELVENFAQLGPWEERYRYLIELGRKLPPMTEAEKTEASKVRGCMSQVWLVSQLRPGPPPRLEFRGDSDALRTGTPATAERAKRATTYPAGRYRSRRRGAAQSAPRAPARSARSAASPC